MFQIRRGLRFVWRVLMLFMIFLWQNGFREFQFKADDNPFGTEKPVRNYKIGHTFNDKVEVKEIDYLHRTSSVSPST